MSYDYTAAIPATFKKDLDSYLNSRTPVTFLVELRKHLKAPHEDLSRVVGQGESVSLITFSHIRVGALTPWNLPLIAL